MSVSGSSTQFTAQGEFGDITAMVAFSGFCGHSVGKCTLFTKWPSAGTPFFHVVSPFKTVWRARFARAHTHGQQTKKPNEYQMCKEALEACDVQILLGKKECKNERHRRHGLTISSSAFYG